MAGNLYVLWLPIITFDDFFLAEFECVDEKGRKIASKEENTPPDPYKNDTWKWRILELTEKKPTRITVDSLGFFYIETGLEKKEIARYVYRLLDELTKKLILKTFLNEDIQHIEDEKEKSKEEEFFIGFISGLIFEIDIDISKVKVDLVCFSYNKKNRLDIEDKIYDDHHIKISLDKENKGSGQNSFNNLLNRNFDRLLKKSIYFSKEMAYDSGEVYDWLDLLKTKWFENISVPFDINIDENSKIISNYETKEIISGILKKLVQDTIEESTLLYFLKVTEKEYLRNILSKISSYNDELHFQNQMLFANSDFQDDNNIKVDSDENIEIFVQNLLRSIPNFHSVDNHIKEAYYIKIGNLTTDMQVNQGEGIVETYSYEKWSFSISHFIEIVDKIKESLQIYHQNKNLKELEDISYNENYQADIEDIRDLKNRNVRFDEESKNYMQMIAIFLGLFTLSVTFPIWEKKDIVIFIKDILSLISIDTKSIIDCIGYVPVLGNFFVYLLVNIIIPIVKSISVLSSSVFVYLCLYRFIFKIFLEKLYKEIHNNIYENKIKCNKENIYYFDESDYDKHEHRSNKPFINISIKGKKQIEDKISISYNDTVSASQLLRELKETKLTRNIGYKNNGLFTFNIFNIFHNGLFTFNIFPYLLRSLPKNKNYKFRENYRISRFDKVSIKLMVRYKISDLNIKEFIGFVKDDKEFLEYYKFFIEKQKKSLQTEVNNKKKVDNNKQKVLLKEIEGLKEQEKIIDIICNSDENYFKDTTLNFYIVYSFSLKLKGGSENNRYDYFVFKDQSRVHFHISHLYYKENLEEEIFKQEKEISEIIYIYFLARMKKFNHDLS